MIHFDPGDVDFRATATRFVNILVFLLFFENWGESSIACAEYSASKVMFNSLTADSAIGF